MSEKGAQYESPSQKSMAWLRPLPSSSAAGAVGPGTDAKGWALSDRSASLDCGVR